LLRCMSRVVALKRPSVTNRRCPQVPQGLTTTDPQPTRKRERISAQCGRVGTLNRSDRYGHALKGSAYRVLPVDDVSTKPNGGSSELGAGSRPRQMLPRRLELRADPEIGPLSQKLASRTAAGRYGVPVAPATVKSVAIRTVQSSQRAVIRAMARCIRV
jgi:hypothetical protein